MKVIAQLGKNSKAGSIIFEGIWEDTSSHDKTSSDNHFGRVMRALSIHLGNPIRSKQGIKVIRHSDMGLEGIDINMMLGIQGSLGCFRCDSDSSRGGIA